MSATVSSPLVTFYRAVPQARLPRRADRTAAGTLPMRAARHCEAVTAAAGFGWWVFPPMEFSLLWDGQEIFWSYPGVARWMPLSAAQFPKLREVFDAAAPPALAGTSPPFLTALPEPGLVQVWTGLLARTAPEWSLLVRPPANFSMGGGYSAYEGLVETDHWFGPLFTNLRLARTGIPITFRTDVPLLQAQPVPRLAYSDDSLAAMSVVESLDAFSERDWADYHRTVVAPNDEPDHRMGAYAAIARKSRRAACPFAAHAG